MASKKLSIVIPVRVYNNNAMDQYLQQCVDSIQQAKEVSDHFEEFEVIVVDDASENNSLSSVHHDGRMSYKLVRSERNLGIGGARNLGVENSDGEYIWFIDGDDMVTEDWCKLLYHIDENKDKQILLVAFESIRLVDAEKKTASKKENMLTFKHYASCPVTASCKVIRRDKFVKFTENVYLEDVAWTFKQLDNIDSEDKLVRLTDVKYWRYLNFRPTAYTRTNQLLQDVRPSFFELLTKMPLCRGDYKDKAVSDLLRVIADCYDLRRTLKNSEVKSACASRALTMFENVMCQKWSH